MIAGTSVLSTEAGGPAYRIPCGLRQNWIRRQSGNWRSFWVPQLQKNTSVGRPMCFFNLILFNFNVDGMIRFDFLRNMNGQHPVVKFRFDVRIVGIAEEHAAAH